MSKSIGRWPILDELYNVLPISHALEFYCHALWSILSRGDNILLISFSNSSTVEREKGESRHEIERDGNPIYFSLHSPLTSLLIHSSHAYFSYHFHSLLKHIYWMPCTCLQRAPQASSCEKVLLIPTLSVRKYSINYMKKPSKFSNWTTCGRLNNFQIQQLDYPWSVEQLQVVIIPILATFSNNQ